MKIINYREKMKACWLGKSIGGTLGGPNEGFRGLLDMNYYDPVPADMLPNDDLDLQVLWACVMNKMDHPEVDRNILADAWLNHYNFHCNEYGVAIRNLKNGIRPPYSGSHDNHFMSSMGAAIRSELWACLAPGNPELAAAYAYEDACVDHAGDGIYAEVFLAALESQAFTESDINKLIQTGLALIPSSSALYQAIVNTCNWHKNIGQWKAVREEILSLYHNADNITDVMMNVPFIVLALLEGSGDFGKTICIANNCGMDTDCTAATAGSIMGIINPSGISREWLAPIGGKLVLSDVISGITPPETIEDFCDIVASLRERLGDFTPGKSAPEPDWSQYRIRAEMNILRHHCWLLPEVWDKVEWKTIEFPGHLGSLPVSLIPEGWTLMMRFKFKLSERKKVVISFNSRSKVIAWIDRCPDRIFDRDCGGFYPALGGPIHQSKELELEKGEHALTVGMVPRRGEKVLLWNIGIGEMPFRQWIHGAFI